MCRYKLSIIIFSLISLVLSACGGQQQLPTPTIVLAEPSKTVKPPTPTQTVTSTPTSTSTPSPTPLPPKIIELYDFETETTLPPFGFVESDGAWTGKSPILSELQIDDTTSHSGNKSLKISGDKNTKYWAILIKPILPLYKSIEVSYFVKGNNIRKEGDQFENCYVGFIVDHISGETEFLVKGYDGTFPWTQDVARITERKLKSYYDEGSSIVFAIFLSMSGEFWIDDLKFVYDISSQSILKQPTEDLPERVMDEQNIEMALIPAGEVEIEGNKLYLDNYYIDVYEVTNEKFTEFLNVFGNRKTFGIDWINEDESPGIVRQGTKWTLVEGEANKPVTGVSFYGALAFCTWRNGFLPTEAQWIKAARGGLEDKNYPWGDEKPDCNRANFGFCVGDVTPVGSYPPNGYGLFDMAGNVMEWVADIYGRSFGEKLRQFDPFYRVMHGGSFDQDEKFLAILEKTVDPRGNGYYLFGFRCVRMP